jgi:hypothetical protein
MSADAVRISDVTLERLADSRQLSAMVDGEHVWYRFPADLEVVCRPEAFLGPALFEAMVRGVPLRVADDMPVSTQLLQSLPEVQSILNCWNSDLHIVPVEAQGTRDYPATGSVACCFSGGVDSSYTYACNRDAITHLLLVEGFAAGRGEADDWQANIEARQQFADAENKTLVAVSSNVTRFLGARRLSILLTFGGILCGLAAGLGFRQLLVPASHTYRNLIPAGSHPLVDPLWSTEKTTIIHHGANATRNEKTAFVARHQYLLDQLQVCWFAGGKNCGTCGKCTRTALTLHLLKVKSERLPAYRGLEQLKPLRDIEAPTHLPYLEQLVELADDVNETAIARRLRRYVRSYRLRKAFSNLAGGILGARGRACMRRLRPRPWHEVRATLESVNTSPDR